LYNDIFVILRVDFVQVIANITFYTSSFISQTLRPGFRA